MPKKVRGIDSPKFSRLDRDHPLHFQPHDCPIINCLAESFSEMSEERVYMSCTALRTADFELCKLKIILGG